MFMCPQAIMVCSFSLSKHAQGDWTAAALAINGLVTEIASQWIADIGLATGISNSICRLSSRNGLCVLACLHMHLMVFAGQCMPYSYVYCMCLTITIFGGERPCMFEVQST